MLAFLLSRDFAVNFFANLGGALFGVLLAFTIERAIARRNAGLLYGHILLSVRSELSYLRPQCESVRDRLRGGDAAIRQSLSVPATQAALVSPLVHERSPYSLVMTLTALNTYTRDTDEALQTGLDRLGDAFRVDRPDVAAASHVLMERLARRIDAVAKMIAMALEGIDAELARLKISAQPDPKTQEVSRRLIELLKREKD